MLTSLIGLGYYGTITPPVVRRNVLENPAWYTAYTPYQPEISQGRLEALLNFQTVVTDLTGPRRRRVLAARRVHRRRRGDVASCTAAARPLPRPSCSWTARLPTDHRRDAAPAPTAIGRPPRRRRPARRPRRGISAAADGKPVVGVIVQYPDASGEVSDWAPLADAAHAGGALVTACADLLALTLVTVPGEWGADIAVGSASASACRWASVDRTPGYMAVHKGLERQLPGRLVGVSVDAEGHQAYRLALQTREQHIRREKATSNICTAQVLLAVMATMYAVWHGPDGLTRIARRVSGPRPTVRDSASRWLEVSTSRRRFFDTLTVSVPGRADEVVRRFADRGMNLRRGRRRPRLAQPRRDHNGRDGARSPRRLRRDRDPMGTVDRRGAQRHLPALERPPTSSPTRSSTRTTPRRRCCATCAGSPTATSRSTAA